MRHHRLNSVKDFVYCLAAAISLSIVMASTILAQQGPGEAARPPVIDPKRATHDRQYSEARLRGVEVGTNVAKANQQRIAASIEQTKQDFKRIQIIRNEMVDNLVAKKPLDYKLISDHAGEINKRANRLKTHLMPPTPDDKEKSQKNQDEFNNEEMQDALVKLCNLIFSFTENPVLKKPGTTDVKQSARAGADLLSIIALSDNVRKSAERLKK